MSHPYVHAESSVKKFGGNTEDYLKIHSWFDESKSLIPDWRHRMLRHHVEGIEESIEVFGEHIINSEGKKVSVYEIGVQHQIEDVGFLPKASDWVECFDEEKWKQLRNEKIQKKSVKKLGNIPKTVKENI